MHTLSIFQQSCTQLFRQRTLCLQPMHCIACRLNKCGVISPRYDVNHGEIEAWVARLLPSRLVRLHSKVAHLATTHYFHSSFKTTLCVSKQALVPSWCVCYMLLASVYALPLAYAAMAESTSISLLCICVSAGSLQGQTSWWSLLQVLCP